jgi:hypothetical protein
MNPQYWKSDHIIEEIPKIIINLDSDSDTDSEGDHDSEGETTDMYWSAKVSPLFWGYGFKSFYY